MNIEQLEKGKELRLVINELTKTKTELEENFKTYCKPSTVGVKPSNGVSISFNDKEQCRVVSVPLTNVEQLNLYMMLLNSLTDKIAARELEFSEL